MPETTDSNDTFTRQGVIITFLWLIAMLIGGLLLLYFGDTLQATFA